MKDNIYNEQNGLHYTLQGVICYPAIVYVDKRAHDMVDTLFERIKNEPAAGFCLSGFRFVPCALPSRKRGLLLF